MKAKGKVRGTSCLGLSRSTGCTFKVTTGKFTVPFLSFSKAQNYVTVSSRILIYLIEVMTN